MKKVILPKSHPIRPSWQSGEPNSTFVYNIGLRRSQHVLAPGLGERGPSMQLTALYPRTKNVILFLLFPLNDDAMRAHAEFSVRANDGTGSSGCPMPAAQPLKWAEIWFGASPLERAIRAFPTGTIPSLLPTRTRRGISWKLFRFAPHKGLAMTSEIWHDDLVRLHRAVGRLARKRTDTTTKHLRLPSAIGRRTERGGLSGVLIMHVGYSGGDRGPVNLPGLQTGEFRSLAGRMVVRLPPASPLTWVAKILFVNRFHFRSRILWPRFRNDCQAAI